MTDEQDDLWIIDVPVDADYVHELPSREIPAVLDVSGKYSRVKYKGWTAGIALARGQMRFARMLYPTKDEAETAARLKAAELKTKGK